jgi:hypothetical protein
MPTPEGLIGHAEMRVGDTIGMLANASTPRRLRASATRS